MDTNALLAEIVAAEEELRAALSLPEGADAPLPAVAVDATHGRDQSVRDVLWHLHRWHEVGLQWLEQDGPVVFPAPGWEGATFADVNAHFRAEVDGMTGAEAWAAFESSHADFRLAVAGIPDAELSDEADGRWGGGTLGGLLAECSSRHYDWARRLVT